MAYDEQLVERVRARFGQLRLPVEEKRMMGGLCFMVCGKNVVVEPRRRKLACERRDTASLVERPPVFAHVFRRR
jgi:hypothetical protein